MAATATRSVTTPGAKVVVASVVLRPSWPYWFLPQQ